PPRLDRHRAVPTGRTRSAAHSEPAARPRGRRSAGLDAHGPRAPRSRDVTKRRLLLPTIARHLIVEFLRTFALTLAAFVAIYVIADFFDRFDDFLRSGVGVGTIVEAFLYRIPLVISQITPIAVLASALIGLGLLARNNEFVALRSCGVSMG